MTEASRLNLLQKYPAILLAGIGLFTTVVVSSSLDPTHNLPGVVDGPGLTIDESFNVQQGVLLTTAAQNYGLFLFDPSISKDFFGADYYLPDHPPLGRLWLGVFHNIAYSVSPPDNADALPIVIAFGRFGAAVAFGLTAVLLGGFVCRWYGFRTGLFTALSFILMPRLFGHAHLASLETILNLVFTTTVITSAHFWAQQDRQNPSDEQSRGPSNKVAALTGILLGLALLTKIQAVFIPVVFSCWAIWNWRLRALLPLAIWGGVGFVVFFLMWPWLWIDPVGHLSEYLGRTTDRMTLYNFYFGTRFADRETPWHYSIMMFLVTAPIGLQLMGILGCWSRKKTLLEDRRLQLVVMNAVFPVVLFALPVATYDGARLFLVAFPFWAMLIGLGADRFYGWLQTKQTPRNASVLFGLFLLLQGWGIWSMHPCQISYFNLLTAGMRGASAVGFERDYWGSSVTEGAIESVLADSPQEVPRLFLGPTLHQFQITDWQTQWQGEQVHFHPLGALKSPTNAGDVAYAIVFERRADPPSSEVTAILETGEVIHEVRREGVPLSRVYRIESRPGSSDEIPKPSTNEERP